VAFTIFGGRISPEITLTIQGVLPVSDADVSRNIKNAGGLGLKTYREVRAASHKLAVVGGGGSINEHVDTLRSWDGDVWAINGAWRWCSDRGIAATLLASDPHPIVLDWAQGVTRALLETRIDPCVFELLKSADVTTFDYGAEPHNIRGGGSTATCAPVLAFRMGYREATFFGCESCYLPNATHAYFHEHRTDELVVECGGSFYLTAPDFYVQARELSMMVRELPEFLREQSGGLLRAMVENEDHHIRWVSDGLAQNIAGHQKAAA
jgi:hypothetical protein